MTAITKEEQRIADELFTLFDGDKNGTLTEVELEKGLYAACGENPTQKEIDDILKETGVKKGEVITKEKFTKTIAVYVQKCKKKGKDKASVEQEYRQAFSVFDKDKNKTVDKKELSMALKSLGEKLTDKEVNEMFAAADKNKDNKISYEEFITLFTKDIKPRK